MTVKPLASGQKPPENEDHVLVDQDSKSGVVTVTGNVQDPADPNSVIFMEPKAFWSNDAGADEEQGMQHAEAWAAKHSIGTIYVRRS